MILVILTLFIPRILVKLNCSLMTRNNTSIIYTIATLCQSYSSRRHLGHPYGDLRQYLKLKALKGCNCINHGCICWCHEWKFNPDTRCSETLFIDFRVVLFGRHAKRSDGHIDFTRYCERARKFLEDTFDKFKLKKYWNVKYGRNKERPDALETKWKRMQDYKPTNLA